MRLNTVYATKEAICKHIAITISIFVVPVLKLNKIDAAIMETPVADSYAGVNEDIMVVEGLVLDSGSEGVAIALKEGDDELTEKINEILEDIKSQGLIEKWFIEANELVSNAL